MASLLSFKEEIRMSKKYIPSMEGTMRTVMEYDTENGFDVLAPDFILIHHRAVIVSSAYDTLDAALKAWGEWSKVPVRLPDGTVESPMEHFHREDISPFMFWHPGVTEVVCDPRRG